MFRLGTKELAIAAKVPRETDQSGTGTHIMHGPNEVRQG